MTPAVLEFKGTTLPVISITLRSLDPTAVEAAAQDLFGGDAFFEGDLAVLELGQLETPWERADWPALQRLFLRRGLKLVGLRGGPESLHADGLKAGLMTILTPDRPHRPTATAEAASTEAAPPPAPVPPPPPEPVPTPVAETPPAPPPEDIPVAALVVDRPLRSGQQVYARGRDLVVMAVVSAGAEVIADGSIHVYAPLRGRALAGARGDTTARIFTTRFEAELVSIAGVYRTFDEGIPAPLQGNPVQVSLRDKGDGELSDLHLASLTIG